MKMSESISALSKSLVKAQGEVENASKSSVNPHFKSKYADLAEVLNTVRPVFTSHGLAFVQMPSYCSGLVSVETLLVHDSGEWISDISSAPATKQDAQGIGSVITYLRRYSLAAFAGIAQEDDDGNVSVSEAKKQNAIHKTENEAVISAKHVDSISADVELVSTTDISAIRVKLMSANKSELAFCEFYQIESIDLLPKTTAIQYLAPKVKQ